MPDVDILVTHSPPYGILDVSNKGNYCGSKALLKEVHRIKPKLHLFGHIHEARGNTKINQIIYCNVAKDPIHFSFEK